MEDGILPRIGGGLGQTETDVEKESGENIEKIAIGPWTSRRNHPAGNGIGMRTKMNMNAGPARLTENLATMTPGVSVIDVINRVLALLDGEKENRPTV